MSRPGVLVNTAGLRILARIAQDCWPNPPTFGSRPEPPGRAGHHRRPSDTGTSRLGQLINTQGPLAGAESPRTAVHTTGNRTQARVNRDSWSRAWALEHLPRSPWTSGQQQGPSDNCANRPGELVDTAGPRNQARVFRESWSIPRALRPKRELPGTMVDPAVPRTLARVAWDSWLNPRGHGDWCKSSGRAGRP